MCIRDRMIHSLLSTQVVATLPSPSSQPIRALQYSPHRKHQLATVGDEGTLVVWDSTELQVLASFSGHTAAASSVNYSPINKLLLASAGLDRKLLFYDCNDRKVIKSIDAEAPLTGLSFLDDGVTVAAGTSTGLVLVYDLRRGSTPLQRINAHPRQAVSSVMFQRSKSNKLKAARTPASTPSAPVPSPSPVGAAQLSSSDLVTPAPAEVDPPVAPVPAPLPVRRNLDDELQASQVESSTKITPQGTVPTSPPTTTPNPLYGDNSQGVEPSPSDALHSSSTNKYIQRTIPAVSYTHLTLPTIYSV
eukprot:TRINITY_DN3464_c0_g2_i1.p1 TRINITY_DN3464_c0_g2~~TRINITY_DN3464_c0_g2_i1.p1  ORF type:complete len:304 (+),score=50.39 TRINITY_DN3464_c0_g2_i1:146-1057(+)